MSSNRPITTNPVYTGKYFRMTVSDDVPDSGQFQGKEITIKNSLDTMDLLSLKTVV